MTSTVTDHFGRGLLTRWMPVFGQATPMPPDLEPFSVPESESAGRFLNRVLFSAKRLTAPAAVLSVVHQIGEALVPVIAGRAIDRALSSGDPAQLFLWLGLLALNFLMLSFAYRFSARMTAQASELAQHRLRATLSRLVLHPSSKQATAPDGRVVSTMTNDVSRIGMLGLVVFPVGEAAGVIFIAVSLLAIHWPLGVIVVIGAPLVVWLMGVLSGKYERAARDYQNLLADTVSEATDLVTGYRVIRGIGAEAEATARYRRTSQKTLRGAYRFTGALGRFLLGSDTLSGVFIAIIAALAGWFAITGALSIGGLIAAVGLTQALMQPLQMLTGNAVPLWAAAKASSGRVIELITQSIGTHAVAADSPRQGESCAASSTAAPLEVALPSLPSIQVPLGQLVGVRADDRTAALMMTTLLRPHAETNIIVFVGGRPACALDDASYRAHVLVAPHHGALFSGTIAENLALPNSLPELRQAALHAAGCDDFLITLGGAAAPIGEGGNRLSGGQRQRLALARALCVDAPVLVLHEPTTAVDSVTETRIAARLREIRQNRATLLFTSSPALLGICDRVIDLRSSQTPGQVS